MKMNSRQEILIALIILLLFSFPLFIVFGDKGLSDLNNQKQNLNDLIQYNAKVEQEVIALKHEVNRLQNNDLELIEQLARDDLNMIREGEVILKPGD